MVLTLLLLHALVAVVLIGSRHPPGTEPDLRLFVFALFFIFGGITSLNDIIIPKLKGLFTTLDAYDCVPRAVLDYLGRQLNAPATVTLRALHQRRVTRFRHQTWACQYLGVSRSTLADEAALVETLKAETAVTVKVDQIRSNPRQTSAPCPES